jgi:hypothetical protein
MSLIRPEAARTIARWREVLAAGGVLAAGLWLGTRPGWLLPPVGAVLGLAALAWGLVALRRMRFAGKGGAPGVVEVVEGQIAYFGPAGGGFVAVGEIVEIAVILDAAGRRAFRLAPAAGPSLTIPVEAEGAARLHDALAQLPGIDLGRIAAASGARTIGRLWRHPARGRLARAPDGTA